MKFKNNFRIITNLAISIDGKISTKDREHIDPTPYDRYMMDVHRRRAHAVLIGARTLRTFKQPAIITRKAFQLWRKARRMNPHPINVVLATKIDFDPSWPFFSSPHIERVLVVPEKTSDTSLKPFRSLAHIFKYENRDDYPEQIVAYLRGLGCKSLLLEGGGGIMFPWAERNLIDEWNVTISPVIIGGESAPTMVEGEGFDVMHIRSYRIRKCFRRAGQVFLQYQR